MKKFRARAISYFKKNWFEVFLFFGFFVFAAWLMWHTFRYRDGTFYIATKAWSDFAANIPLIRSFSWGKNFPPEYPLFPGEPIRYHFFFYLLVGFLERLKLPLDWALNLPSALGFFGLMVLIYLLAKLLFEKRQVGFLAVIFFLFNGSLSFLEFFRQHPISSNILRQIASLNTFPSFGPYDGKIISAFWNLNIYTNQRHLAGAYALVLLVVFLLIRSLNSKKSLPTLQIILSGFCFGLLPFYHKVAFLMLAVILAMFFLLFSKLRRPIFLLAAIAGILAIPQLIYQLKSVNSFLEFNPGYLVSKPLTFAKTFVYWWQNLGLSLFLIPAGVVWSKKVPRKVFFAFLPLFLIGNLFQFSPEIAANHKFFNLFLIVGNIFSAYVIYRLWQKKLVGKIVAVILTFFMILSGIIDFFPIKNDSMMTIPDAPKNPDILWIKENTPPDSLFLNSSYIYHPASLAGRKIFLGWPYFSWSAGYNTTERGRKQENILGISTTNRETACQFLKENHIQYISITRADNNFPVNFAFWRGVFVPVYENQKTGLAIFLVKQGCE